MNDPIVVWPPGTFFLDCNIIYMRDCTGEYPFWENLGYIVCCPV